MGLAKVLASTGKYNPANWPMAAGNAPPQYYWKHLAYMTPEHRAKKQEQYLSRADQLTDYERKHAESIL